MSNNDKKDIINTTADQLQDLVERNAEKTKEENKVEKVDNVVTTKQATKYDEEKTIIVNGKNYKFGTVNEIIEKNSEKHLNVKLYLNDKLIKSYEDLFYDVDNMDYNNLNNRIILKSVLGTDNKEYIVVVYEIVQTIDSTKELIICNQEGQTIGILQGRGFNEGIGILNEEHDGNYKINADSINIYVENICVAKIKYTINNDCLTSSIEKVYKEGEYHLTGK